MRVCVHVDTSLINVRIEVSVKLIDSLSITGLEYGTTFLAIQLFADFEIEYLSLPESNDNFLIPCLNNPLVYNKHKKNFWALPLFGVRCQLKTTPKTDLFPLHLSYSSTVMAV